MTDSYYELIDATDAVGEKFRATDLARGTWSASIQHGGPVSALLVRALERCAQRDDTRLSRVVIDLLGGVPAEGDLWVRSQVQRGGKQIELTPKEFSLLEYFMRNAGRRITRNMIIEFVWKLSPDTMTNVVDVYVNYLRKKIDDGAKHKLIHTIRGVGYEFGGAQEAANRNHKSA